jgi:hypothetical protein
LSTNVFVTIFTIFTNLVYRHFGLNDNLFYSTTSLIDLLSATYYPSNIAHLNVRVRGFDDCLRLLAGGVSQLHTFIVQVDGIHNLPMIINNTVTYFKS